MNRTIIVLFFTFVARCYSGQTIVDWMFSYHITHDDSRAAEFWDTTVGKGAMKMPADARGLIVGFAGAYSRDHPRFLPTRIKSIAQFPEGERDSISIILWLSKTEFGNQMLVADGRSDMAKSVVPAVAARGLYGPQDCSFLRGWYYASGDLDALKPMIAKVLSSDWRKANAVAEDAAVTLREICASDEKAYKLVSAAFSAQDVPENVAEVFQYVLQSKNG